MSNAEVSFQKATPNTFIAIHHRFSPTFPSLFQLTSSNAKSFNFQKPTCKWNAQKRLYECPISQRQSIKEALEKEGFFISDIPTWVLTAFTEARTPIKTDPNSLKSIEETASLQLYDFQHAGIRQFLSQRGIGLLADAPNLFKSSTALATLLHFKREWPLLIVVPSWKKEQWKALVIRAGISHRSIITVEKANTEITRDMEVLIISYDMCAKHATLLQRFRVGIADHTEELKCYTSQKTQTLLPIFSKMKHKLLIARDLQSLKPKYLLNFLKILSPSTFRFPKHFLDRYCDPQPSQYIPDKLDYEGISNQIELQYILANFLVMRDHSDIPQLPQLTRSKVYFQSDKAKSARLAQVLKEVKTLEVLTCIWKQIQNDKEEPTTKTTIPFKGNIESKQQYRLPHLETLNIAAKSKGIRKFVKDYEFRKSTVLFVVKSEEAHFAVIAGLEDIDHPFKVIRNSLNIPDQHSQTPQITKQICYIIDYNTAKRLSEQSSLFLPVSTIIFTEMEYAFESIKSIENVVSNESKSIKCLFLMTAGGSLDETLYDMLIANTFNPAIQSLKSIAPISKAISSNVLNQNLEDLNEFKFINSERKPFNNKNYIPTNNIQNKLDAQIETVRKWKDPSTPNKKQPPTQIKSSDFQVFDQSTECKVTPKQKEINPIFQAETQPTEINANKSSTIPIPQESKIIRELNSIYEIQFQFYSPLLAQIHNTQTKL